LCTDDGVVRIQQGMPVTVTHLRGPARGVHDVGEQDRGENPIIGHFCLVAGEELVNLLEGRLPRFYEVEHVAPWQLNVFRARYVVGDFLALLRPNERIVAVMDDKGRYADGRKNCMHVHLCEERQHEFNGPRARRQAFMSRPRGPDLLIPRHVRINGMFPLPGAPHADPASDDFFVIEPIGADAIGVALEHDQRGGAGRMCCREQRTRRERADGREKNRFATPELVEHCGDAVGPLLRGRQRARRDGIGGSRARLVEEDQPTERCHRLDPALKRR
jgi:hypothetical protein